MTFASEQEWEVDPSLFDDFQFSYESNSKSPATPPHRLSEDALKQHNSISSPLPFGKNHNDSIDLRLKKITTESEIVGDFSEDEGEEVFFDEDECFASTSPPTFIVSGKPRLQKFPTGVTMIIHDENELIEEENEEEKLSHQSDCFPIPNLWVEEKRMMSSLRRESTPPLLCRSPAPEPPRDLPRLSGARGSRRIDDSIDWAWEIENLRVDVPPRFARYPSDLVYEEMCNTASEESCVEIDDEEDVEEEISQMPRRGLPKLSREFCRGSSVSTFVYELFDQDESRESVVVPPASPRLGIDTEKVRGEVRVHFRARTKPILDWLDFKIATKRRELAHMRQGSVNP